MKKRRPRGIAGLAPAHSQPIDPADLAAGYLFPELFADEPFSLISEEAEERPFAPSAAVQHTIPDLPPVDWEHIRKKDAARRRQRRARRSTSEPRVRPLVFVPTAEAPDKDSRP
jgi:hypothetical protein